MVDFVPEKQQAENKTVENEAFFIKGANSSRFFVLGCLF